MAASKRTTEKKRQPKKRANGKAKRGGSSPKRRAPVKARTAVAASLRDEVEAQALRALEVAAKRRVAEFLERTLNAPEMRERMVSFEQALIGGLRNMLVEAAKDLAASRFESREATCFFLFGLLSSLRTVFYREAVYARALTTSTERRVRLNTPLSDPEPNEVDVRDAIMEASVFDRASLREDVLSKYRARMSLRTDSGRVGGPDRLEEQARVYDVLNPNRQMPKA